MKPGFSRPQSVLRVLDGAGITLESINLSRPTLDDVFLTLTGRSLRDDSPVSAQARGDHGDQGVQGVQGVRPDAASKE